MKTSFKLIVLICALICFFSCKNSKEKERTSEIDEIPSDTEPDWDWILDVVKFNQSDYLEYILADGDVAHFSLFAPFPVEEMATDRMPWISLPNNYYIPKWYWRIFGWNYGKYGAYFDGIHLMESVLAIDKWTDLDQLANWEELPVNLSPIYSGGSETIKDEQPLAEHLRFKLKSLWRFVNDETLMNEETMLYGHWEDPRLLVFDSDCTDKKERIDFVFNKSVEMLNTVIEAGRLNELIAFDKQVREQEAERFHGLNNQDPYPYSISSAID